MLVGISSRPLRSPLPARSSQYRMVEIIGSSSGIRITDMG